ncbi:phosphotransferase [Streptomyces collinus]|uniref:phosphotransferase n=1 Tax=Streptomyces collinus TaxID=42684 RepID=UPI0036687845
MTTTRRPLTVTDLAPLARATLGRARALTGVERLRGGTKKGVYRLTLDDGSTAVAYVWSADEDYWDQPDPDPRDPLSHGTGLGLFTAAHDRLAAAGVRTSRLRFADSTHTHLPADVAVVEDLTGGSLEDALARDPDGAPQALERMAELLAALHVTRCVQDSPYEEPPPSTTATFPKRGAVWRQGVDLLLQLPAGGGRTGVACGGFGDAAQGALGSTNTSSSGSASAPTTRPCAPPAWTRPACGSTACRCTSDWSRAR